MDFIIKSVQHFRVQSTRTVAAVAVYGEVFNKQAYESIATC